MLYVTHLVQDRVDAGWRGPAVCVFVVVLSWVLSVDRDTGDGYERYLVSDSVLGPNGGGIAMFLTAT